MGLRSFIASSGPTAIAVSAAVATATFGAQVYRASELFAAALLPGRESAQLRARVALGIAPVLLATGAAGYAASSGALPAAATYLIGKLLQRVLRDLCSNAMTGVLPAAEVVDAQGNAVPKSAQTDEELAKAGCNMTPTMAAFILQEYFAPAPAAAVGVQGLIDGLPYVAATGLVEAVRAVTGTHFQAKFAHDHDRHLRDKEGGGWARLKSNLKSTDTLRQVWDSTATRESMGILPDMVGVIAGRDIREGDLYQRLPRMVIRAACKSFSEPRTLLMNLGQTALKTPRGPAAAHGPSTVLSETGLICEEDFHSPGYDPNNPEVEISVLAGASAAAPGAINGELLAV